MDIGPKDIPESKYNLLRRLLAVIIVVLAAPAPAYIQAQEADISQDLLRRLERTIGEAREQCPDQNSRAYRTNFPLARLQLKKARLAEQQHIWDQSAAVSAFAGLSALARLAAGKPTEVPPGQLTELAYEADSDGSVQPYHLYLPANYAPDVAWPLIVFLHGYVPSITVLDPWLPSAEVCNVAGDNGCMLLVPYGRRNTDFQGIGEVDVLRAMHEVRTLYNVDAKRIYISGVSMGGMGAWNMLLRHPGLFAAAAPISGHTDMFRWWGWPRGQAAGFKRWLVEWDNPLDLAINLRNQPTLVQHGELDGLIPAEQSRLMVQAAKRRGLPIEYYEFPGQGHYIYWDLDCYQQAWSWLVTRTLNPSPKRISFKTYSLEYNQAFWVTIEDFQRWGQPAEANVQVSPDGSALRVRTNNVSRLKLDVMNAPLQKVEDFDIIVNGEKTVGRATANWDLYVSIGDPPADVPSWPPRKRKGLCGPVEEVFDGPFVVVAGTGDDDAENKQIAERVQRWAGEWEAFSDGQPRITTDEALTEEAIKAYNLVLFGTPQTNCVLARVAARLPIQIGNHRYQVGPTVYEGEDLGLIMCYPNPLAPDRYLAVYAGQYYGDCLPVNHKLDLLPDFIIFSSAAYDYDDANWYLCAGFFDMNWQIDQQLIWRTRRPD